MVRGKVHRIYYCLVIHSQTPQKLYQKNAALTALKE